MKVMKAILGLALMVGLVSCSSTYRTGVEDKPAITSYEYGYGPGYYTSYRYGYGPRHYRPYGYGYAQRHYRPYGYGYGRRHYRSHGGHGR